MSEELKKKQELDDDALDHVSGGSMWKRDMSPMEKLLRALFPFFFSDKEEPSAQNTVFRVGQDSGQPKTLLYDKNDIGGGMTTLEYDRNRGTEISNDKIHMC